MNNCVVCSKKDNNPVFQEFGVDILRCANCNHIYSSFKSDPDYDGYFELDIADDDHFWWRDAHQLVYTDFRDKYLQGKSGRLLDMGCGLGYFVKFVSEISNWEAFGCEISHHAVEFARSSLNLANIVVGRVEESGFPNDYFDIITLWDVIEHIFDPNPLLKYLYEILKDDGFLFLHTPNVNIQLPKARIKKALKGEQPGISYMEACDHLNDYSEKTLSAVLQKNGFDNLKFVHIHPTQSVNRSKNPLLRNIKNGWFNLARILAALSSNKINIDNLSVVCRKNF